MVPITNCVLLSTESTVLISSGYSFVAVEVKVQKYNKTLNVRSLGKPVSFVFPRVLMVPRLRLGKHQDSRENKTNCFPRDLTLSVYCFLFFCDNCRTEVCCFVCLFVCFFRLTILFHTWTWDMILVYTCMSLEHTAKKMYKVPQF